MKNLTSAWTGLRRSNLMPGRMLGPAVLIGVMAGVSALPAGAHEAHVHGRALMQVALDGGELHLRARVPGMDVVGFEHRPATDSQRHAMEDAVERLNDPVSLVRMPLEGGCSARSGQVRTPLKEEPGHDQDPAGASPDEEESHAEFVATHVLQCESPQALEHLDVTLLSTFSGLERVDVEVVTEAGETAARLRHGNERVLLP